MHIRGPQKKLRKGFLRVLHGDSQADARHLLATWFADNDAAPGDIVEDEEDVPVSALGDSETDAIATRNIQSAARGADLYPRLRHHECLQSPEVRDQLRRALQHTEVENVEDFGHALAWHDLQRKAKP